jgi:hypothetical protein
MAPWWAGSWSRTTDRVRRYDHHSSSSNLVCQPTWGTQLPISEVSETAGRLCYQAQSGGLEFENGSTNDYLAYPYLNVESIMQLVGGSCPAFEFSNQNNITVHRCINCFQDLYNLCEPLHPTWGQVKANNDPRPSRAVLHLLELLSNRIESNPTKVWFDSIRQYSIIISSI